jgi:hypothetical protein
MGEDSSLNRNKLNCYFPICCPEQVDARFGFNSRCKDTKNFPDNFQAFILK